MVLIETMYEYDDDGTTIQVTYRDNDVLVYIFDKHQNVIKDLDTKDCTQDELQDIVNILAKVRQVDK